MAIPDKYKKAVPLVLTLVFYLTCLYLALGLKIDERVTALLPDSDPEVADFDTFITQVPAAAALYIQISTQKQNPKLLEKAGDTFYAGIKDQEFFSDIIYQFSHQGVMELMDLVNANKYRLLDPADLSVLEDKMDARSINALVLDIKRKLLSPSGSFSTIDLTRDPFGLSAIILKRLAAFQSEMPGARAGESRIISKNGKSLLIVASPKFPAVETLKSKRMLDLLNGERNRIIGEFNHKIDIGFSGAHPATLDNSATIQSDVKRAILVLTLGILVMGFLFFSRVYHVILIFLPTLVSLTFASAAAALFSREVSAIALGCGAVLVGITVDFGIHILFHADTLGTDRVREIVTDLKKPVIMGATTTMAAFGCLIFSSLPGQRQMGLLAVIGIFGAAAFSLVVLKYFITIKPWTPSPPRISLVHFTNRLMRFRKKHMVFLSSLCIVLTLAGLGGLSKFTFEGDVAALNHLTPRAQRDMDRFLSTWGQVSPAVFMVKASTTDHALERNDALFRLLEQMKKENLITGIASLSDIFPSMAKQETNLESVKSFFTPGRIRALETKLENAGANHGFSRHVFSPFIKDLENILTQTTSLSIDAFKPTVIYPLVKSKLIISDPTTKKGPDTGVMVLTTAQIKDRERIPEIANRIKSTLPGTLMIDRPYFIEKITGLVAGEFRQFFCWAALSMVMVLFLFWRRVKRVAVTITPVCLSAVITAGLLGLFGIPLNLISIVFIIFVFGVGVDFSIFLVHHELTTAPDKDQITPGAVIICAMTTIGAFACLCFAQHKALFSIGAAGLIGMLVSLFLALVIIPFLCEHWILDKDKHP